MGAAGMRVADCIRETVARRFPIDHDGAHMRFYGISGVRTDASGRTIEEALLHRFSHDEAADTVDLQRGIPMRATEVAGLLVRGDHVSVVHMSPQTGAFETGDSVRLKAGLAGYLQSF